VNGIPGVPEDRPHEMLELPGYQWTAPRATESIYRAPETDGDPLEILARYRRMLDEPPPLPSEIAASDRATLDALLANTPKADPAPAWMGGIGSLTSVPVVIDAKLAPGRVELRDRAGNVTRALFLAGGLWIEMSGFAAPPPTWEDLHGPLDPAPPPTPEPERRTHRCGERCTCPAGGKPMYYAPSTGQHACQDPDCEYAHPDGD
jgi:hypothetical protein